jgi:hypothetical protein
MSGLFIYTWVDYSKAQISSNNFNVLFFIEALFFVYIYNVIVINR